MGRVLLHLGRRTRKMALRKLHIIRWIQSSLMIKVLFVLIQLTSKWLKFELNSQCNTGLTEKVYLIF